MCTHSHIFTILGLLYIFAAFNPSRIDGCLCQSSTNHSLIYNAGVKTSGKCFGGSVRHEILILHTDKIIKVGLATHSHCLLYLDVRILWVNKILICSNVLTDLFGF